jgi:hypothetical protein
MATETISSYATTGLTFTNLHNLAIDGFWMSNFITPGGVQDILVSGVYQTDTTTAPGAGEYCKLYVVPLGDNSGDIAMGGAIDSGMDESVNGDTVLTEGEAGDINRENLIYLGANVLSPASQTAHQVYIPEFSVRAVCGYVPQKFVLVFHNAHTTASAALDASGNEVGFKTVSYPA